MHHIFIDGKEGTTGLEIFNRFAKRTDVEIISIPDEMRKDTEKKREIINNSDYVFLCLPDDAARESVSLIENPKVKVIDASTAHRTNPEWAYGFPELSAKHREKIATSHRVAVGGCYASGFLSLCYPLVSHEVIAKDHPITCYGISGFSGGGKSMIADYTQTPEKYTSPRFYGLTQNHKHLPEMQVIAGLAHPPLFNPIVDDFYNGMVVSVPLHVRSLNKKMGAKDLHEIFAEHYAGQKLLKVMPFSEQPPTFMDTNALANTSEMEIFIYGSDQQILLCSRFDNLGKGASGSAVQCMNIMMNIDETTGLS
ncbi:MAG: N-acetyl-gamma-glutamyl-phosphate reductase [Eubacteriales bacterium]